MSFEGRMRPTWAIGLMSGTSVDGIDGVLARFEGQGTETRIQTLAQASRPMPAALRSELLALQHSGPDELDRASEATRDLTDLYAEIAIELRASSNAWTESPGGAASEPVDLVIGAHGQTVRHRPERAYTLQLIDGARLAELSGLSVVADFRSADVAAGGQGAPLVPAFHALAFSSAECRRAIINIGGIANVSLLPLAGRTPSASQETSEGMPSTALGAAVTGFDTGPGNLLMDDWCERHTGAAFDQGGQWAATGKVDEALLAGLLREPYFAMPAPKSTGRDLFSAQWLEAYGNPHGLDRCAPQDVQATLLELTALAIARACNEFGAMQCFVCGGGAFNLQLMNRLTQLMPLAQVSTTNALGMPPDAVEALAFAWLARQRMLGLPANLPAVTGARGPRILGAVYPAPP